MGCQKIPNSSRIFCKKPDNSPPNRNPANKPPEPPPPEKEKSPPAPSFLMGFWKERFPDDDHKQQPDRRTKPSPADMNRHDTNTYDPTDPTHNAPPPEPPKKRCTIL